MPRSGLPQVALPLGRVREKCLDGMISFLERLGAATPRPRGEILALPRNPGGPLLRNSGRLIFSPPLLSPDRVRPWTSVWRPPRQRQLAELLHRRHTIENFVTQERNRRMQGIQNRPQGGRRTDDRTRLSLRPFGTRPKRAASVGEIPSSLWKHEIQIALLRRRAAMARAVLPNPLAAEWLFAGIINRAQHHHDLYDSETDTAIPDDDDDIVSPVSYAYESV